MEGSKTVSVLNPRAPEFFPAKPYFVCPPPFGLNRAKPRPKQPHRFWLCNRKCLPPRMWKQKHLPCTREGKLKSLLGEKSSVMIRNIPNNFGREDLLKILDNHCHKENKEAQQNLCSYDFLYLPMDFVKHGNLGYAFVNFTSSMAALRFGRQFDSFVWTNSGGNKKICEIAVAKYQGKEELSEHFKNARFPCHTDEYLPVVLSPPSDGFTSYSLTTLGNRVRAARLA